MKILHYNEFEIGTETLSVRISSPMAEIEVSKCCSFELPQHLTFEDYVDNVDEVLYSYIISRDRDFMQLYGIISNLRHVFTSKFGIMPYKCMKSRSIIIREVSEEKPTV